MKTNGLKFSPKPIDRGPRFSVAFHGSDQTAKAKELLLKLFDINEPLADEALSTKPGVICRGLDQQSAVDYVKRLKAAGDFRVWAEGATGKMKQMNLKQKVDAAPAPIPEVRKR